MNDSAITEILIVSGIVLVVLLFLLISVLYGLWVGWRAHRSTEKREFQRLARKGRRGLEIDELARSSSQQRRHAAYDRADMVKQARDAERRARLEAEEKQGVQAFPASKD